MRAVALRSLAIGIGLASGWLIGWGGSTANPPSELAAGASFRNGGIISTSEGNPARISSESGRSTDSTAHRTRVRRLIARLQSARAGEISEIWEDLLADIATARARSEFPLGRSELVQLVMHEWASRDPDGAWDYLQQNADDPKKFSARAPGAFATAWLAVAPEAAIEKITARRWTEIESRVRLALAKHDVEFALQHWQASAGKGSPMPRELLQSLAAADPQRAFAILDESGDQLDISRATTAIVRGWPLERLDELLPELAARFNVESSRDLESSYRSIGRRLAVGQPLRDGLEWILSQASGDARTHLLDGFLQNRRLDQETLSRIAALPREELTGFGNFEDLLNASFADSGETWKWLQSLDGDVREKAFGSGGLKEFARGWGLADLDRAFETLGELSDANISAQREFADGLGRASGELQPRTGLALAPQLPVELRSEFMRSLAQHWSQMAPEDFIAHFDAMPDGSARTELQRGGFATIAANQPDLAGARLLELFEPGEKLEENTAIVAEAWAVRDSSAAQEWVEQLPEHVHDTAASSLGEALEQLDPKSAARAYASIQDPDLRAASLTDYLSSLAELNRKAALELVQTTPMDKESRREILESIDSQ